MLSRPEFLNWLDEILRFYRQAGVQNRQATQILERRFHPRGPQVCTRLAAASAPCIIVAGSGNGAATAAERVTARRRKRSKVSPGVQMLALFQYDAGSWEVDTDRRELRAHGRTVPLGSRAFDIVEKLAESAGRFVSRDELVAHVWRGAVVEESTLRVHIYAIRKALGPDRTLLKTASGRGYRLLGSWTSTTDKNPSSHSVSLSTSIPRQHARSNLPAPASDMIGRDAVMQQLRDLGSAFRVVTLTGLGGIGKTTLAVALARALAPQFDGRVCFVELASLADPGLVPASVAMALGLKPEGVETDAEEVARGIGTAKVLLVLDNCEHVVEAAATLAEAVVRRCPSVSLLVTSREVLKIEGERVFRVPPLDVPGQDDEDHTRLLQPSAVALFVERMQAMGGRLAPGADNLSAVAAICRQLDGIPLAIEFAAARAATLGVQQVAAGLRDRFGLLTNRRRTALPQHRTLRAALDWSHDLLTEKERSLLQHLAVFAGGFTLDAAVAVVGENEGYVLLDAIDSLVTKSLVSLDEPGEAGKWRLPETIRAYAFEKLEATACVALVARRHAEYHRDVLERSEPEWPMRPAADLQADYAWRIDNVRAALDWAFSGNGDASVGIALASAAVPLWMHLSLYDECRGRAEHALSVLANQAVADPRRELRLRDAVAGSLAFSGRLSAGAEDAWERCLQLARSVGDVDYQLRSLFGLWLFQQHRAIDLARQFSDTATTEADRLLGRRLMGVSHHYQGNQGEARRYIEDVLGAASIGQSSLGAIRFQLNQKVATQAFHARILWVQGLPVEATRVAGQAMEQARAIDHGNTLCHTLAFAACPVALWTGDLEMAEQHVRELIAHSRRHALAIWEGWGGCHLGMLRIRRGDLVEGVAVLRANLERLRKMNQGWRLLMFQGELALALSGCGRLEEGSVAIRQAVDHARQTAEGWIVPELLRIKGELLRLSTEPREDAESQTCFRDAIDEAHRQGALSWELRAASSLAELLRARGRAAEAQIVLKPVYDRFTEGLDTHDLRSARAILDSLQTAR